MTTNNKVFPCLNCGEDTGCSNKLVCDLCRTNNSNKKKLDYFTAIKIKKNKSIPLDNKVRP